MTEIPEKVTIGEKYKPAMEITDQGQADEYFEACVQHSMSHGLSRVEAEKCERMDIGYFAGWYSHETRARIEKLYRCSHPVLGSIEQNGPPTVAEAIAAGIRMASAWQPPSNP